MGHPDATNLIDSPDGTDQPETIGCRSPARPASPTRAWLPPAYTEVAQLEMFRGEDLAYALRLGQAGVPVEFHLHPGAPHQFDFIAFNTTAARSPPEPSAWHRQPCSDPGGAYPQPVELANDLVSPVLGAAASV